MESSKFFFSWLRWDRHFGWHNSLEIYIVAKYYGGRESKFLSQVATNT